MNALREWYEYMDVVDFMSMRFDSDWGELCS